MTSCKEYVKAYLACEGNMKRREPNSEELCLFLSFWCRESILLPIMSNWGFGACKKKSISYCHVMVCWSGHWSNPCFKKACIIVIAAAYF